jgi:hypothetical protein
MVEVVAAYVPCVECLIEGRFVMDIWNSVTIPGSADPDAELDRLRTRCGAALGSTCVKRTSGCEA